MCGRRKLYIRLQDTSAEAIEKHYCMGILNRLKAETTDFTVGDWYPEKWKNGKLKGQEINGMLCNVVAVKHASYIHIDTQ